MPVGTPGRPVLLLWLLDHTPHGNLRVRQELRKSITEYHDRRELRAAKLIFVAGALLGIAGGALVGAIQEAVKSN